MRWLALMLKIKRLLPQAAFDAVRQVRGYRQTSAAARAQLTNCVRQIRGSFPELRFRRASLVDTGSENVVVNLDDQYMFRFPRRPHRSDLLREIRLLQWIQGRTAVRVPEYRFVPASGDFAGYAMVGGRELQPKLFRRLDLRSQEAIVLQIADFFRLFHAAPAEAPAAPDESAPALGDQARFSHCDFALLRDFVAARVDPSLISSTAHFFAAFGRSEVSTRRVVHGDLLPNHVLLDDAGNVGIIDFGDAALGDPAWDFAVIGSYAPWIGPLLMSHYPFAPDDPELLARAARQAVRYWFERLVQRLNSHHTSESLGEICDSLRSAIDRVGF
jgi:aminoglycoside 2''-phosphotransferase